MMSTHRVRQTHNEEKNASIARHCRLVVTRYIKHTHTHHIGCTQRNYV